MTREKTPLNPMKISFMDRAEKIMRRATRGKDINPVVVKDMALMASNMFRRKEILFADQDWCDQVGISGAFLVRSSKPVLFVEGRNGTTSRFLINRSSNASKDLFESAFSKDLSEIFEALEAGGLKPKNKAHYVELILDGVLKGEAQINDPRSYSLCDEVSAMANFTQKRFFGSSGAAAVSASDILDAIKQDDAFGQYLLPSDPYVRDDGFFSGSTVTPVNILGDRMMVFDHLMESIPTHLHHTVIERPENREFQESRFDEILALNAFLNGESSLSNFGSTSLAKFVKYDASPEAARAREARLEMAEETALSCAMFVFLDVMKMRGEMSDLEKRRLDSLLNAEDISKWSIPIPKNALEFRGSRYGYSYGYRLAETDPDQVRDKDYQVHVSRRIGEMPLIAVSGLRQNIISSLINLAASVQTAEEFDAVFDIAKTLPNAINEHAVMAKFPGRWTEDDFVKKDWEHHGSGSLSRLAMFFSTTLERAGCKTREEVESLLSLSAEDMKNDRLMKGKLREMRSNQRPKEDHFEEVTPW